MDIAVARLEALNMDATQVTTRMTPCGSALPELEVPMINTMVTCLGSEHRKLDEHILQLAFAATRLASDPNAPAAKQRAVEVWDEIRRDLWSHLQIEDGVFSWGEAHHAISDTLRETIQTERQEMRKLVAALSALSSDVDREPRRAGDDASFSQTPPMLAQTLLALARTLDSHVERYEGEVLPSILRALFHS
jgi:hypothetical protein